MLLKKWLPLHLFCLFLLLGCSSGGGHDYSSDDSGTDETVLVSGVVAKGPASGAKVDIYSVGEDGEETFIGSTTTDDDGGFNYSIPASTKLLKVKADLEGASVEDEVTGNSFTGKKGDFLTAVCNIDSEADSTISNVTPFSTMAEEMARSLGDGICTPTSVKVANNKIKSWVGVNFLEESPSNNLKPALMAVAQMVNGTGSISATMHNMIGAIEETPYGVSIDGNFSWSLYRSCEFSGSEDCARTNFNNIVLAESPVNLNSTEIDQTEETEDPTVPGDPTDPTEPEEPTETQKPESTVQAPWTLILPSSYSNGMLISDGTTGGTQKLELPSYSSSFNIFTSADNTEAILHMGNHIYSIDGTDYAPETISESVAYSYNNYKVGSFHIVSSRSDSESSFITDGTQEGTRVFEDLNLAIDGSSLIDHSTNRIWDTYHTAPYGSELFLTKISVDSVSSDIAKDIYPGAPSGTSGGMALLPSGKVVFGGSGSEYGLEPWISDGTEDGTFMLYDLYSGSYGSRPSSFTSFANKVAFTAFVDTDQAGYINNGYIASELVITDGTKLNTVPLDINPGAQSSSPEMLGVINEKLYFTADIRTDDVNEKYILSTDGDTFTKLAKINTGASLLGITADIAFFNLHEDVHGDELWIADLSNDEFKLVKDILPGTGSALADTSTTMLGDLLLFSAYTSATDSAWFISDGSEAGTIQISESGAISYEKMGDHLFFIDGDSVRRMTLASISSSTIETILSSEEGIVSIGSDDDQVFALTSERDLYSVGVEGEPSLLATDVTQYKVIAENVLYLIKSNETDVIELWFSDGTEDGTRYVSSLDGYSHSYNLQDAEGIINPGI